MKNISCIIVDDELIARNILASHLSKINSIQLIASCSNAIEAANCISSNTVDLVFLDINMPEITGISFAKSINKNIKIIFTTAYREYAIDGFELQAVDYLLKPISFERFFKAVNLYFDIHYKTQETINNDNQNKNFFFVRSDRKMLKIDFEAINYIESYSDYIKIHLQKEAIITRETITAIEAKLPAIHFIRIHRSYIIALKSIQSYTNEYVVINNKSLPISRSYKESFLKRLQNY